MNGLIIYFSRTGRTRRIAEAIQEVTGFDLEEIKEKAGRDGTLGFLKSGMESTRRMLPQIIPLTHDPAQYDIVIIGTPIWASNMSSPIRAFITEYKNKINKIALFCTGDGVEPKKVFISISELLGKEPMAIFGLIGSEREDEEVGSLKIQQFAGKLSSRE
jgi:flavodoxin